MINADQDTAEPTATNAATGADQDAAADPPDAAGKDDAADHPSYDFAAMGQHRLSAAFPGMSKKDFAALSDDIAEEGQHEPITIYEGMILDGWHRYQACIACDRVPVTVELSAGVDPVAFVVSCNLRRRDLTGSQRAVAVAACSEWATIGRPNNTAPGAGLTTGIMAEKAGVGTRTMEQAKAAHTAGLGEAVRDGKITAKQGAVIAKLPEDQRAAAIANPAIFKVTKKPKATQVLGPETVHGTESEWVAKAIHEELVRENEKLQSENEGLKKENGELLARNVSLSQQAEKLEDELCNKRGG